MNGLRDLAGRVAIVTGGASGIGKAMAKAFRAAGAHVVIADVEAAALEMAADEIGALGVRTDVTRAEDLDRLAARVEREHGRADILCNNAGVAPKVRIQDATEQDWRWIIDVNLWGVIHGTRAFLPMLLANPAGGHIVNTASAGGFVTGPMLGTYSVTKAGVVAMSEALAWELRESGAQVGVTILAPGPVRTNLHTSLRNRPAELTDTRAVDIDLKQDTKVGGEQRWITADSVGPIVIDAIRRNALYATTHDFIADLVQMRMERILADFRHPLPATQEAE